MTKVENDYLHRFRERGLIAQRKKLDKWRSRICTISAATAKVLVSIHYWIMMIVNRKTWRRGRSPCLRR